MLNYPKLWQWKSSLGPLEWEVMALIWKNPLVTTRQVRKQLQKNREIAYTTVMTVMDHLYEKGFLIRDKRDRAFYYQPKITWAGAMINSFVPKVNGVVVVIMVVTGVYLFYDLWQTSGDYLKLVFEPAIWTDQLTWLAVWENLPMANIFLTIILFFGAFVFTKRSLTNV